MAMHERLGWRLVCALGCASAWLGVLPAARAETDCEWLELGRTRYLRGDCQTDETLLVPEGFTLDGRGHRIKVVDPEGGAFAGAVVRNAGATAHVRRLVIDAGDLGLVCHPDAPEDTRLRAILLQDADGSVTDNQIVAINQGAGGCQEGNGVEVRASQRRVEVLISANRIEHFQKTGIVLIGSIDAGIYLNRVAGEGPIAYNAQNGIQLRGDVRGSVKLNHVSGVSYTGSDYSATGILLLDVVDPVEIALNRVEGTGVGIHLSATNEARVTGNRIESSTYDGIAIDGRTKPAQNNQVIGNFIAHSGSVGIDLFGAGARHNVIKLNAIVASGLADVQEVLDAGDNLVRRNGAPGER